LSEKDRGWMLHLGAGAIVGLLAVVGFGREVLQHDWSLTGHQFWEGAAWPLGGIVVLVLGLGLLRLVKSQR
jgi:hypothetical protein